MNQVGDTITFRLAPVQPIYTEAFSSFDFAPEGSPVDGNSDEPNGWSEPWVSRINYVPGFLGDEPFTSYSNGDDVNGLNGGLYWDGAFVVK